MSPFKLDMDKMERLLANPSLRAAIADVIDRERHAWLSVREAALEAASLVAIETGRAQRVEFERGLGLRDVYYIQGGARA